MALKKIVNCNQSQYNSLVTTGSAVIGGQTVPFDPIGDQHQVEFIQYLHTLVGYFSMSSSNEMYGTIHIISDSATPITSKTAVDVSKAISFNLAHTDHGAIQHHMVAIGTINYGIDASTGGTATIAFDWSALDQYETNYTDTVTTI